MLRPSQAPAQGRLCFRLLKAGALVRCPLADQLTSTHQPKQSRCPPGGGEHAAPGANASIHLPVLLGIRSGAQ